MNRGIYGLPGPVVPAGIGTIWVEGGYYGPPHTGNMGTGAATANRMYVHPLVLGRGVYDAISTQIFTLSTGTLKMAIWEARPFDCWPGRRIAQTGDISSGSTGIKDGIIPRLEVPFASLFWVGLVAQGGTPTLLTSNTSVIRGMMPGRATRIFTSGNIYDESPAFYIDSISGDMPGEFPEPSSSVVASTTLTQIYVRAALCR